MNDLDLARRVEALEHRIAEYQRLACEAIEDRDRFILREAQGVLGLIPWGAFILVGYLAQKWFGDSWLVTIAAGVLGIIALGFCSVWLEAQKEKDVARLRKLPDWDWVHPD